MSADGRAGPLDRNPVNLTAAAAPFLRAHLFRAEDEARPYLHLAVRTPAGWYVIEGALAEEDHDYQGCPREEDSFVFRLAVLGKGKLARLTLRLEMRHKRWPLLSCTMGGDGNLLGKGKRLNAIFF